MEYFRKNFFSSIRDNDVELHDLESGRSIYPSLPTTPLEPLPADAAPNFNFNAMHVETSLGSLQLGSPAETGMQSDNPKRLCHQDQAGSNKVRIVAQRSRIPTLVSLLLIAGNKLMVWFNSEKSRNDTK